MEGIDLRKTWREEEATRREELIVDFVSGEEEVIGASLQLTLGGYIQSLDFALP